MNECKRDCCWTPFGHSQEAQDCHCHELLVRLRDPFEMLGGDAA